LIQNDVYNNTISNNSSSAATTFYGLYASSGPGASGNVYGNILNGNTTVGGTMYMMYIVGSGTMNAYKNNCITTRAPLRRPEAPYTACMFPRRMRTCTITSSPTSAFRTDRALRVCMEVHLELLHEHLP